MREATNRAVLLALMLVAAGTAAACNITFSQIDFSRIERSGAPDPGAASYAGGGVYPPVGPGR